MKSVIMFVAASFILVVGIVAVAIPNAVQAAPLPHSFCVDGNAGLCGKSMPECKDILAALAGEHKCLKTK